MITTYTVSLETDNQEIADQKIAAALKDIPFCSATESKKETVGNGYVLCLRTVNKDHTAYNGFIWPETGEVSAPDWNPKAECGGGLHGYLRGVGDGSQIKWNGLFQVVSVLESEIVDLGEGKVKFPRCTVVFTGSQKDATDILVREYPGLPVIGATVVVGDNLTANAGNSGTAIAGNRGTATACDYGTATVGICGTATAGNYGTASAGINGTAIAGDNGILNIKYWNGRYRVATAYVGENGILPNVKYKLNKDHNFVVA